MRTTALIVAAGRGQRLGGATPKQFQPCAGHPLAWHALSAFCSSGEVDEVVVALPDIRDLERYLAGSWPVPVRAVAGGAERQDSVAAGLALIDHDGLVMVHDAARPLVSHQIIRDVRRAAAITGAAVPALPCTDTIKEVAGGRIRGTVDRQSLCRIQTPQAFHVALLRRAHEHAETQGASVCTDDASLVEQLGVAVAVVAGDEENLKVTGPADLGIAEALLAARAAGTRGEP
jgi:2-C-methyl-D-erythritol 4-phosphate cytidylyltransferase